MSDPDLELLVDELVLQEDQDSADLELTTFVTEVVFTEEVLQLELAGDTLQLEVAPQLLELEISTGPSGPAGPPGAPSEDEMPYDLQVDTTSATVTYIGQAQPGTATSAPPGASNASPKDLFSIELHWPKLKASIIVII